MTHSSRPPAIRFGLLELETFLAVVDYGSFHAASKALSISQPAVTLRIQKLEAILKTRLLNRTTRRVELTPAGKSLYEQATRALSGIRSMLENFQADALQARRHVVVAASPIIAALSLPVIIRRFSERYPELDAHIRDMQYDEILAAVHNGDVDLGVLAFEDDSPLFSFEPLGEDDVVVVVPMGHALSGSSQVTLETLSSYPILLLQRYDRIAEKLTESVLERGLKIQIAPRVTNLTTLLAMLDAGHGVALLPRSMAQTNTQKLRETLPLEGARYSRRFGILTSRRHPLDYASELFCEQLREDFLATLIAEP